MWIFVLQWGATGKMCRFYVFKCLGSVRFLNVFERSLLCCIYSRLHLLFNAAFFFIYKNIGKSELLLQCNIAFSILIYFKSVIYSCDGKAEFSAVVTPIFSVTWSFRNHSNMLICCSRKNRIIINVEMVVLLNIFVKTWVLEDSSMNRSACIEKYIFTTLYMYGQFNASF